MTTKNTDTELATAQFSREVKDRSDVLVGYFLAVYFLIGFIFAFFYDTWSIAIGIGSMSLIAYYSAKKARPDSNLYQYVLSVVLGVFMAQFIYQMHGLFEVHFFAFIGSAILITYQNWKLQIPIMVFVIIHHLVFAYLQNSGYQQIYFTQLDYFELPVFIIHIFLSGIIFFVCGLWAYQLKRYSEKHISQGIEVVRLQKEAYLSAQLKQNEQRFSSLIQKGADMIAIIDRNSCFKFVSPSFYDHVGYDPAYLLKQDGRLFIHPEDLAATRQDLEKVFTTKEIAVSPYRFRHANGEWRWFETIITNMLDQPSIDGIVCNSRDITVRKQQDLEREQIIKELTKSNADLKQFSYITSHNLRAPLSNMIGILNIIDYSSLQPENREMLNWLQTSTKQLSTTIHDLTSILLIKNNIDVEVSNLNVQEIFDYVHNIFAEALKEVKGTIETYFVNSTVTFNRAYLQSIFINLISNAIKYHSPDRPLVLKIYCKTYSDEHTELTFTDNGSGIDLVRHKDRLFGLYQRFHNNASGAGLGLFIVKEQVAALGGDITVESEPGMGTSFTIMLNHQPQPGVYIDIGYDTNRRNAV